MTSTQLSVMPSRPFIDGDYVDATEEDGIDLINPATGELIVTVQAAGREDVGRAVDSAARAQRAGWGDAAPGDRARVLRAIAELIAERSDELGRLESLDGGKPLAETRQRMLSTAAAFDHFADVARGLRSDLIPTDGRHLTYTRLAPVGVVGAIIPWNYPLPSCGHKLPAALAMGNSVVLKPAEEACLTPMVLGALACEAGLPAGVLNVVPGRGEVAGRALVAHPGVGMISFTGSTATGREIARVAGDGLKQLSLELGGKSAVVLFDDADVDGAVDAVVKSFTRNQGQICTAGTRLLVQRRIFDDVCRRVTEGASRVVVGDPSSPDTEVGAVINEVQLERIESYVALARAEGANVLCGGERPVVPECEGGFFYTPTVLTGLQASSRVVREEIFGPVLVVLPFDSEGDAVAMANDSEYGLAGSVWSSDAGRVHRVAERLEAGIIWANTLHAASPSAPYGGWKSSGLGVEGGIEQARGYTRSKTVWLDTSRGSVNG